MKKCPYCGGPLAKEQSIPPMTERYYRLYAAVTEAGPAGIDKAELMTVMNNGRKATKGGPVLLRVSVHYLNRKIAGLHQRIYSKDGRYFLVSLVH